MNLSQAKLKYGYAPSTPLKDIPSLRRRMIIETARLLSPEPDPEFLRTPAENEARAVKEAWNARQVGHITRRRTARLLRVMGRGRRR